MFRIAVLVSGGGTNLQALIDAVNEGRLKAVISAVIADRPSGGLRRAAAAGIPALMFDRKIYGENLSSRIAKALRGKTDLIILAGFLSILDTPFIREFRGRIINIHPSLLPAYGGKGMHGLNVHRAVLAAGEKFSGCSVHMVEEGIDTGKIIAQTKVPVMENDTPESLAKRVLREEHKLIISAAEEFIK